MTNAPYSDPYSLEPEARLRRAPVFIFLMNMLMYLASLVASWVSHR